MRRGGICLLGPRYKGMGDDYICVMYRSVAQLHDFSKHRTVELSGYPMYVLLSFVPIIVHQNDLGSIQESKKEEKVHQSPSDKPSLLPIPIRPEPNLT